MNKNLQNGFILGAALQGKTEAAEPQGEIEITENGTYDVSQYANADVDVDTGKLDHTVSFIVGENDYAKFSVADGIKIPEPIEPVVEGMRFNGWYDGDVKISFPYTPTSDKEIHALITEVAHPEWVHSNAGYLIASRPDYNITKLNDGWSIFAVVDKNPGSGYALDRVVIGISDVSQEAAKTSADYQHGYGTTNYEGKTYYYSTSLNDSYSVFTFVDENLYFTTTGPLGADVVKRALDAYFGNA